MLLRYVAFIWVLNWLLGMAGVPPENYYNQGNRWYASGRFDLAEQAYRRAVQGGRVRGQAYFNAGNTAFQRGDFTQAMTDFEAALELDPEDDDAWHNLELARRKAAPPAPVPEPPSPSRLQGAEVGRAGREDVFTLSPESLAEYIKTQTLAGYPFRPGSSLPKRRTVKDEVEDW